MCSFYLSRSGTVCYVAIMTSPANGGPEATTCLNLTSLYRIASSLSLIKKTTNEHHKKTIAAHDEIDSAEEIGYAGIAVQILLILFYALVAIYKKCPCGTRRNAVVGASRPASPAIPLEDVNRLREEHEDQANAAGPDWHRLLALTNTALYIRNGIIHATPGQEPPPGKNIDSRSLRLKFDRQTDTVADNLTDGYPTQTDRPNAADI